jgi:hypothetical protein
LMVYLRPEERQFGLWLLWLSARASPSQVKKPYQVI